MISGDIHSAYAMAPVTPVLKYVLIGNCEHFILQAIIQYLFLNFMLDSSMEHAVRDMSPQAFTQALRQSNSLSLIMNCAVIVPMQHFKSKAFKRAWSIKNKKNELEKQKIFLLSFSHELRNLLNSLTGNIKLTSLEKNLSERVKELLLNAEVCGELLLHLVNNILDTGKVEIGELEVDPKSTKIFDALERIWSISSELIRHKGLLGTMTIQKDMPRTLLIDHYRLTQIFLNIVSNAIKFTETGTIDINIRWKSNNPIVDDECFWPYPFEDDSRDEGLFNRSHAFDVFNNNLLKLNMHARRINKKGLQSPSQTQRGVLKVTITDTGCGMSKEETNQLFKKFAQVSSDQSKRKLGTGLGLFISKQLWPKNDW